MVLRALFSAFMGLFVTVSATTITRTEPRIAEFFLTNSRSYVHFGLGGFGFGGIYCRHLLANAAIRPASAYRHHKHPKCAPSASRAKSQGFGVFYNL
jgi:hypothetical protein